MASRGSDSEDDLVTYGTGLEPLEEGERPKKPLPIQDQTVRDEKGRYKRFHGAFSGGFSAGYFNTVGSKEGWTPSTFISSRQNRADKTVLGPEDFMDEEDLSEFGIAPKAIVTTDDFASKTKDRIREKARQLAAAAAPIPGATVLDDLIAPAKLSIGFELLRKMGWKEGQGVGPRVKRKPRRQKPVPGVKIYGCALPPTGSEGSEDDDDDYLPDNVTFAPKDTTPVDFTPKDNVHGLAYKGLDPQKALFGISGEHFNLFSDVSEGTSSLLGSIRPNKGRKLGISGQAFGVGALEEEDDDIYATEALSKYDTILKDEEPGDGLYGWTAPKQYKSGKGSEKDIRYVGKILDGFSLASKPLSSKQIYPPPELPKDYRPVHYFRPVITSTSENSHLCQALSESTGKILSDMSKQSRYQLNASKRGEMLGETPIQGSMTSVLEFLSQKDKERINEMKWATEVKAAEIKAEALVPKARNSRFQPDSPNDVPYTQKMILSGNVTAGRSSDFRPFAKDPEKQKRYEKYLGNIKQGEKDALESCLDPRMTEWERGRERDEFVRAAVLYKPSSSSLSSRFTHAKQEDDTDQVEVPRDQENDVDDKLSAVKMKMFGKLTRDKFEWHPEKLLCKRFNIPDPYPDSTIVGLPKVKRDKYSVFNFLTIAEPTTVTTTQVSNERAQQNHSRNKPRKPSRWDIPDQEEKKEDSISEFLSMARSEVEIQKQLRPLVNNAEGSTVESSSTKVENESADQKNEEGSRPSMDLFKAIFASSSDEKSSSSEEDESENEDNQADPGGSDPKIPKPSDLVEISSDIQVSAVVVNESVPPVTLQKMQMDEREEFGPRLPPVFCPNARQKHEPVQQSNFSEGLPKEKPKKSKEKRKTKKDHKHKKEKKKKHKKHKQKGKQKNKKTEKSSSSESVDSSDSQSDTEKVKDISPEELLRRLKRLPLTKK